MSLLSNQSVEMRSEFESRMPLISGVKGCYQFTFVNCDMSHTRIGIYHIKRFFCYKC